MSQIPPPPLGYATPSAAPRADLRTIAQRQRALMFCILGYLALVVARFVLPPSLSILLALAAFAVSITAAVFVFMLALSLYSTGVGVLLGILTLIPLVGLIVLLVINSKATGLLRQHGLKVGLLGADPAQIPSPGYAVPPVSR
ncbi:MAG: hypothetical protein JWO31_3163 [Phycisphaerales bacterium]|nr:hypothetical protein [Phycisphaerales bacterium]